MRVSYLAQAVSALAFSATAYSAAIPNTLSPSQIVTALQGLTTKATALKNPIEAINAGSATAFLTGGGQFPSVIAGIQDIAVNAQGLAVLLQGAPNITAGSAPANAVIQAYQTFATVQQQALTTLNQRLTDFPAGATVAAPLNIALNNLQVALTNLFNSLSARLTPVNTSPPTTIVTPQNGIQTILNQLLGTVTGLLNGLSLNTLLGGILGNIPVPVPGVGSGAPSLPSLPSLPGLPGLTALPVDLPISSAVGSGLSLGTLPILGPLLGSITGGVTGGGSNPTGTITNILNGVLGGGILAKA